MRYLSTFIILMFTSIISSGAVLEDPSTLEDLSSKLIESFESQPGILVQDAALLYMNSDYEKAAEYYIRALLGDLDDNPITLYNLSCCFGLLDEPELAGRILLQSTIAGFDRLELVESDTDFSSVRDEDVFIEYLNEATTIMEESLELQNIEALGERLYLEFPSLQTARVHLPDNFDPQREYDLVLALHGYGGDIAEFSARWTAFDEGNFIFASLQAPYAFERNDRTVFSWTLHGSSDWERGDMPPEQKQEMFDCSTELSSDLILACISLIEDSYRINRTFLLGFSQGGILAYRTGFENSSLFAGIATFSGVVDTDLYPEGLIESSSSLPVFIGRGTAEDDRAILTKELLHSLGYDITYFEYEGGHFIPDEGLRAFESWIREMD